MQARRDPWDAVAKRRPRAQGAARRLDPFLRRSRVHVPGAQDEPCTTRVDLPEFVVAFLCGHRKEQNERKLAYRDVWGDHDIVFDDGIGQSLSPWTVSADFRRVVSELGLPRTRFHDLRHAHATQLLSSGVHVKAVSERLGHSSTSFTMDTYSAEIPSMGRTAADAADQLFG